MTTAPAPSTETAPLAAPSRIVAVTVTYNGASVLAPFLACALAQRGVAFHLVVVDNASSDATRAMLAEIDDPRITVILNAANIGVAAANNQGIDWALAHGAARVLLINNDTEFDADLFAGLDARLAAAGGDAITPRIPFYDEPGIAWYAGGSFARWRGVMSFHDNYRLPLARTPAAAMAVDYAPTCCLLFDRAVFDKIGLMDERYFVYWDDSDFCWRMHLAGLRIVYDPHLTLLHKVSSSTGGADTDFSIRHVHRNQMVFLRKFHGRFWLWYTILVMAAKAAVRRLAGHDTTRQTRLRFAAMREGLAMNIAGSTPARPLTRN